MAMEQLIRMERIEINGLKNVCHGVIEFNEYRAIEDGQFHHLQSVLGVYGQNGSGKTTVLDATKILKIILTGGKLPENFNQMVNNELNHTKLSYTFFIDSQRMKQLVTYTFLIEYLDDCYQLTSEKITSKVYSEEEQKWKSLSTLIECNHKEIVYKTLAKKLKKQSLIELGVAQDIDHGSSFIFHERNRRILLEELLSKSKEENARFIDVLQLLPFYANTCLLIIENDVIGSINLNTFMPISLYLSDQKRVSMGNIPVNLLSPNVMPKEVYRDMECVIEQIDAVIHAIIPSLHLRITNQKDQYLEDGTLGTSFDIVSERNEKFIPLKYESEGIKRLISVISSMIAAYNHASICLMIDEFDSGIFEYLLGELVEIIDESAKGQFIFTSHNLRALEKLSYKSIIVTTTNPNNRYIQLSGVKSNNNIRDYYYTNILLGGQEESIYEETKNYKIKRAFRKAGKMNG